MKFVKVLDKVVRNGGRIGFFDSKCDPFYSHWVSFFQERYFNQFPVLSLLQIHGLEKLQASDLLIIFEPTYELLRQINMLCPSQIFIFHRSIEYIEYFKSLPFGLYDWLEEMSFFTEASVEVDRVLHSSADSYVMPYTERALFLDRDDIIVKNIPYNGDPAKVELIDGVVDLINRAHNAGFLVVIVSNQSGLSRGSFTWAECMKVHSRMCSLLARQGAWIDDFQYASFHETGRIEIETALPNLRKPRPGMFLEIARKLRIYTPKSVMIGDRASDILAAFFSGVQDLILFKTDHSDAEMRELGKFESEGPKFGESFKFRLVRNFEDIEFF